MARLRVLAFVLALGCPAAGAAQAGEAADTNAPLLMDGRAAVGQRQLDRPGFAFPVIEYTGLAGERQQRRGVILARPIAPDTTIGLGFFETVPRTRGFSGEAPGNLAPRRTKRAAVGLFWSF